MKPKGEKLNIFHILKRVCGTIDYAVCFIPEVQDN